MTAHAIGWRIEIARRVSLGVFMSAKGDDVIGVGARHECFPRHGATALQHRRPLMGLHHCVADRVGETASVSSNTSCSLGFE
jgi:hypothetical protein